MVKKNSENGELSGLAKTAHTAMILSISLIALGEVGRKMLDAFFQCLKEGIPDDQIRMRMLGAAGPLDDATAQKVKKMDFFKKVERMDSRGDK